MKKQSWWQSFFGSTGLAAGAAISGLKRAAYDTMGEAQRRVKETVRMVIKATIVFLIIAFGFVFVLVGLAKWLDASNGWLPGTGAMIVGGAFIVIGLFALVMRK